MPEITGEIEDSIRKSLPKVPETKIGDDSPVILRGESILYTFIYSRSLKNSIYSLYRILYSDIRKSGTSSSLFLDQVFKHHDETVTTILAGKMYRFVSIK